MIFTKLRPNQNLSKFNLQKIAKCSYSSSSTRFINKPLNYKKVLIGGGLGLLGAYTAVNGFSLNNTPGIQLEARRPQTNEENIIEPCTGLSYPRYIQPLKESPTSTFQLIGCGVRKVTFMGFTAYSIGIYINNEHLNKLLNNSKWKNFSKQEFLNNNDYNEELIQELTSNGYEFLIQIIPVRNTNGSHIKGGLIRSLQYQLNQQKPNLSTHDLQDIETSINEFGQTFPKGMIEIYSKLNFIKLIKSNNAEPLVMVTQDDNLRGYVDNQWIINNLLRAYLSGKKLISQEIRTSLSDEIEKLIN